MKPIVAELSDTTGVDVEVFDVDDNYELSQKYQVRAVPTFVLVENEEEISRASGAQTGQELAAALQL
jgi:predicted DsbA family dithiol-disulfide isomerase